ncbi:MAG: magnesium transporter, partial [Pseudomonadota bacterium]
MAEYVRREKSEQQLQLLNDALRSGRLQPVKRILKALSAGEIADMLESLPPDRRAVVWDLTDATLDGEILVHLT